MPMLAGVRTLALACHPLPTVAVTAFATLLAIGAERAPSTIALVAVAVGAGQLSIGWGNDLIDRGRDASAGRDDKPLAAQSRYARLVLIACVIATAVAVLLAPALGGRAAVAQLVLLAGGWAYNGGVKATRWSWVPYLVAFAALPVIPLEAQGGDPTPPWVALSAGLLGVAAHLFNAAPDVADDRADGVMGAPARWGARRSIALALVLVGAVAVVSAWASGVEAPAVGALVAIGVVAVATGGVLGLRASGDRAGPDAVPDAVPRAVFPAALALIAVVVVILVAAV